MFTDVLTSRMFLSCNDLHCPPQAETSNAELSLLVNKLQSEAAALRDSLDKLANMNESLVLDKSNLNTFILQVGHFKMLIFVFFG